MSYRTDSQLVEDAFFGSLAAPRGRTACQRVLESFESMVAKQMLRLDAVRKEDPQVKITAYDGAYGIQLSRSRVSFDWKSILAADNPEVDLEFSDEMVNFRPDEFLIRKSKLPLWVIKPTGPTSVQIQRIW